MTIFFNIEHEGGLLGQYEVKGLSRIPNTGDIVTLALALEESYAEENHFLSPHGIKFRACSTRHIINNTGHDIVLTLRPYESFDPAHYDWELIEEMLLETKEDS